MAMVPHGAIIMRKSHIRFNFKKVLLVFIPELALREHVLSVVFVSVHGVP